MKIFKSKVKSKKAKLFCVSRFLILALCLCAFVVNLTAQTTAFTYQGSLKDGASPGNGNYDFEFKLFDAVSAGAQQGSTLQRLNIAVANGIFTVSLDFGAGTLPGADRFLDIGVRTAGGGAFTALNPRQKVNSAPYSVRSLSSATADSVVAGGIPAGSANYIQNTTSPQASSNFNISGAGTAFIINSATQYNIGGNRVLSVAGAANVFAGVRAGESNTFGIQNAFFGQDAGRLNTTGNLNAFFGSNSGGNSTGQGNSFFGSASGQNTDTGQSNVFLGVAAGQGNTSGSGNTVIGGNANVAGLNLTNSTAIGYQATVGASNSLVLGSISGVNGANADTNVGIGTTTPGYKLHVVGQDIRVQGNTTSISPRFSHNFTGGGTDAKKWQNYAITDEIRFSALNDAENSETIWLQVIRSGMSVTAVNFINGAVGISQLGSAGTVGLCRNASNQISTCSSSLRYKTNIGQFSQGMSFVNKLRPVSFDWKDGGMKDVGFGAEDIAKIDPRFVTYNDKGEIEGVKYDRLSVAFVNAFKEQQEEISGLRSAVSGQTDRIGELNSKLEDQSSKLKAQQIQIELLVKVVCSLNKEAAVCKQP